MKYSFVSLNLTSILYHDFIYLSIDALNNHF
nr:MAG TPA: hypothetical protein [Caudoviricetes sp.]